MKKQGKFWMNQFDRLMACIKLMATLICGGNDVCVEEIVDCSLDDNISYCIQSEVCNQEIDEWRYQAKKMNFSLEWSKVK